MAVLAARRHRVGRWVARLAVQLGVPSAVLTRVFQELSSGMLAYNNASKLKEVPLPFAYVQFNALLLQLFSIITPVAIACFT